jgi:hypothetical protein
LPATDASRCLLLPRFGFIGSPLPCLNACTAQGASNVHATPNYNAEADGMASIIAHEIVETSTDPLINAWCAAFHPPCPCMHMHACMPETSLLM